LVLNYYKNHKTKDELVNDETQLQDLEANTQITSNKEPGTEATEVNDGSEPISHIETLDGRLKRKWYEWKTIIAFLKRAFFHGVNMDVANEQKNNASILCRNLEKKHAQATKFDNNAEHAFSYLQVLTAATAAFANGANDISK